MCFIHFVWCSDVATPDLFFLDGADHALNVGVVIRSIVSSVLSLDTVFEKLNEVFRTGLSTIVAP